MLARKFLDRQKAGQLSARQQDPNWESKKNAAFAYAEELDQVAEPANNSRPVNKSLKVDIPQRSRAPSGPASPAERIKHARDKPRGPRADVLAACNLDTARVEQLWGFEGDFCLSQFEGEKPGYEYQVHGPRGAGYYLDGDNGNAPPSPAERINNHKSLGVHKASVSSFAERSRAAVHRVQREVPEISGRSAVTISPIKQLTGGMAGRPVRKARPASAHPSTNSRASRADVPSLQLSGKPTGVQALGLAQPKARPRSAAVSRVTQAASAWRNTQSRGGGTTQLW